MHAVRLFSVILFFACFLPAQTSQPAATDKSSLSISGTVLRADTRAPVPHVQISLNGGGGGDSAISFTASGSEAGDQSEAIQDAMAAREKGAMTDDKGHFTIAGLKPGTYMVHASRAGLVQKKDEFGMGTIVRLQAPNAQNLTILMLASGAITGRVLNELGEPMQNASVQAMRYIYTLQGRHLFPASNATTDDKGDYRLFGLKPGMYFVLAAATSDAVESLDDRMTPVAAQPDKKPEVTVYAPRFYPNETSPSQATPVVVKAGDEAQANFTLTRVPAHKISGKVTGLTPPSKDQSERHIRYVMAMQKGMELQNSHGIVRDDGRFEIPAVLSGRYKVMAIDTDMKGTMNYGFSDVVVDASDVTGVTISMNAGKSQVSGAIRPDTETKLDLSKLYVTFVPAKSQSGSEDDSGDQSSVFDFGSGSGGAAKVQPDGSFKGDVTLSPTPVFAVVSARGSGFEDWYTSKVLLNGKDVTDSGFLLADAQRGHLEIIISAKGGTVEGTAVDSDKKPFPNAQVLAFPSDPKLRHRYDLLQKTLADGQGHFKLRGVRPGDYTVMALEDVQEQPFTENSFLKQNAGKIQTVKVGQATEQIQLQTIAAKE